MSPYDEGAGYAPYNPWVPIKRASHPAVKSSGVQIGEMSASLGQAISEPDTLKVGFSISDYDPILMALFAGEL